MTRTWQSCGLKIVLIPSLYSLWLLNTSIKKSIVFPEAAWLFALHSISETVFIIIMAIWTSHVFGGAANFFHLLVSLKSRRAFLGSTGPAGSEGSSLDLVSPQLCLRPPCRGWLAEHKHCVHKVNFESAPTTTASVCKLLHLLAISSCHCW